MMPYINDPVSYAAKARASSPLEQEDADNMQESMLQIPPWVGVEYHMDTYFTDNMTPPGKPDHPGGGICLSLVLSRRLGLRPRGGAPHDPLSACPLL